jgi:hypothetical protein
MRAGRAAHSAAVALLLRATARCGSTAEAHGMQMVAIATQAGWECSPPRDDALMRWRCVLAVWQSHAAR